MKLVVDVVNFFFFRQLNENYYAHGAKVVEYFQKSDQGLLGLERMWRKHFLEMMRPKYLPSLWSIEHNAERYILPWANALYYCKNFYLFFFHSD